MMVVMMAAAAAAAGPAAGGLERSGLQPQPRWDGEWELLPGQSAVLPLLTLANLSIDASGFF